MTISRERLDRRSSKAENVPTDGSPLKEFAPPFDEPIYTVNEAARILRISPNEARAIFRKEPGVHDLSHDFGNPSRFRRHSQLRIPRAVLARFWKRTEIR
jgi:hypothetical protein